MKGFDLYQQQTMTTHTVDLAKQIVWFGFQFFVLIILSENLSKVIHNRYTYPTVHFPAPSLQICLRKNSLFSLSHYFLIKTTKSYKLNAFCL